MFSYFTAADAANLQQADPPAGALVKRLLLYLLALVSTLLSKLPLL